MEVTVVSFVVPAAKCDFAMSSQDAGLLTAAPMLGMTLGSFFWGFLADLGGRRWVLASSLLMGGLASVASSAAQYYSIFVLLRFLNGFSIVGALSICLPYLGEFQPIKIREKVLCWMELAWTTGIITLPCIAWLIIPLNMRVETPYFTYDSWNAFIVASAIPSIILGAWAWSFPESPKFYYEIGEHEKALQVLRYMYAVNTGNSEDTFEVESFDEKGISLIGISPAPFKVNKKKKRDLRTILKNMGAIAKCLIRPPYRKKTLLTCFISFCLTSSYYTLMMWFPELFTRFEVFASLHPGQSTSVCEVSSVFIDEVGPCKTNINTSVYLNTVFVGLSCIPTSIFLPLTVKKLGHRFFMIFSVVVAACVAVGMYFVTSSLQNLILSCVFESLTSLGVVTFYCTLCEIFPTNMRVVATGMTISIGRIGALLGNLSFGYLIDLNCIVPIAMFAAMLFGTAIACAFVPVKMKPKVINFA